MSAETKNEQSAETKSEQTTTMDSDETAAVQETVESTETTGAAMTEEAAPQTDEQLDPETDEQLDPETDEQLDPETDEQLDPDAQEEETMENLMDLYEESFKRFAEGEVVNGKIISIDKDYVLVDIGYKSEGQIRIHEFIDEEGNIDAKVGDVVEVMVEWWDDEEEVVVLSKEKAVKVKVWEEIKKAHDEDGIVEGTIVSRVKGGFSVDIGVQAFLPGSQADLRPIRNLDEMVGQTFQFKILKYNRKRSNIVLSRRAILEQERENARAATLASISEGKVVDGIVKNITEYGVFVDLGGVDGLLHGHLLGPGQTSLRDVLGRRSDQGQDPVPGSGEGAGIPGHEAADARSVDHCGRQVPRGHADHRPGGEPDRLRRLCGTGGGDRGPDSHFRDVLDPEDPPSLQGRERGGRGRCRGAGPEA
jgi:DNA-directed RNA polymerase subunit E'/Rpb7